MSAALSVQMLDDDVQPVAWLFEHDDGRQRVAFGDGSPAFTHGNPAWHRVGPVEVDPMPANPASVQSFLDLACLYCAVTDTPLGDVRWTFAQRDMDNLAAEVVRQNQRIRVAAPVAPVPEGEVAYLLRKYKKLCVEVKRGDSHHLGRIDRAIAATQAPPTPVPEPTERVAVSGAVSNMTAARAAFFMERFKREEKLLGPNEQAAVEFVLELLAATPPQQATNPNPFTNKLEKP